MLYETKRVKKYEANVYYKNVKALMCGEDSRRRIHGFGGPCSCELETKGRSAGLEANEVIGKT